MSSFLWYSFAGIDLQRTRIPDEDNCDLWGPRFDYNYQKRGASGWRDGYGHFMTWPSSSMQGGDPSQRIMLGSDFVGGKYEDVVPSDRGGQRTYWIHGVCVDGAGNPLGGAVVEMFLSATDVFVNSGTTDSNGIYSVGTSFIGLAHKAYANYGPNTLVGASVDTLMPGSTPW